MIQALCGGVFDWKWPCNQLFFPLNPLICVELCVKQLVRHCVVCGLVENNSLTCVCVKKKDVNK